MLQRKRRGWGRWQGARSASDCRENPCKGSRAKPALGSEQRCYLRKAPGAARAKAWTPAGAQEGQDAGAWSRGRSEGGHGQVASGRVCRTEDCKDWLFSEENAGTMSRTPDTT